MRKRTARAILKANELVRQAQKIITKEVGILEDAGEADSTWDDMLWANGKFMEGTDEGFEHHLTDCVLSLKKKKQ